MKRKSYFSLALTVVYILFSLAAKAGHTAATETQGTHKSMPMEEKSDNAAAGKHLPSGHDASSKVPHGKVHAPHSEELPHIHKFHKERVKKLKKHHSKYWLLSKLVLVLCHLSILVIAYLHATH